MLSSVESSSELGQRYLAELERTNGEVSASARTLSAREPQMLAAEARILSARAPIDRASYERNLARRRPEQGLDRATLWALCLAKASAAESFGASVGTNFDAAKDAMVGRILAHIEAEETYHARTARCLLAGLSLQRTPPPPDVLTRALVRAMAGLPEAWGGGIVVYCGEVTAAALFRLLRGVTPEVFSGQSEQFAAELLGRVALDEEAHARFAWSRLRPADRLLCRAALPLATATIAVALPEAMLLFGNQLATEVALVERTVRELRVPSRMAGSARL